MDIWNRSKVGGIRMEENTKERYIDEAWAKNIDYANSSIHEVGTLGDLKVFGDNFEIECLVKGEVIRKIQIKDTTILMDAFCETIYELPLTTKVYFEPWVFDRGSYLFVPPESVAEGEKWAKFCAQNDRVVNLVKEPAHYPKPDYPYCNKGHNLVEVYNERLNAYTWDCPTCIEAMSRIGTEVENDIWIKEE